MNKNRAELRVKGELQGMEAHGFIRDMLDVKVLILFVMSKLCYQDDCLSYFDLSLAVPEMVETGHLAEIEKDRFVITDKGRETEEVTEDAIAYPVMQRAKAAVERFNNEEKRDGTMQTAIEQRESGDYAVTMALSDEAGELMKLELMAPTQQQARALVKAFRARADRVYQTVMGVLLEKEKPDDHA